MEHYEVKSYKYESGCWVGSIHFEDRCAANSACDELNRLVDKVNALEDLLNDISWDDYNLDSNKYSCREWLLKRDGLTGIKNGRIK